MFSPQMMPLYKWLKSVVYCRKSLKNLDILKDELEVKNKEFEACNLNIGEYHAEIKSKMCDVKKLQAELEVALI